jgi:uncharacterized membrane protein
VADDADLVVRAGSYPRGTAAFDRVVFFSDAVFAIALTLVAVEIGIPEVTGDGSDDELWRAFVEKLPAIIAYAFTFFWVAFYWRANHAFTVRLKAMSGGYIAAVLVYLAFIALLPFPAATLGEYYNAVALSVFLGYMAAVSSLEILLLLVADRDGLLEVPLTSGNRRFEVLASLTPVGAAAIAIPVVFISVPVGAVVFVGVAVVGGAAVNRWAPDHATKPSRREAS